MNKNNPVIIIAVKILGKLEGKPISFK